MTETKTRYLVTPGVMNTLYTHISLEDSGKQRYLKLHFMQTYTTPSPYPHDDVIKWKHFSRNCHLCGEFTGPRWSPRTKASDAEFDVFFDLRLNKRLSKQSWGWWFETLSRSLWRHCNVISITTIYPDPQHSRFFHRHSNSMEISYSSHPKSDAIMAA